MEVYQPTPESIEVNGRRMYDRSPISKSFDSTPIPTTEFPGTTPINERDLGRFMHSVIRFASEMRFRNPWNVRSKLTFSDRWDKAYGDGKDGLVDQVIAESLTLLGTIEEQHPGIVLIPELPFMASATDKEAAFLNIMEHPTRTRRPLQEGAEAIMPLNVDVISPTDVDEQARVLAYVTYAIPDLVGMIPKTDEAKQLVRKVVRSIYQDNEGKKRYMLAPKFLQEHQDIFKDMMQLMINKELEVLVTEIKTNSWNDLLPMEKSDDEIYEEYAHDISHTLLVMMKVFESVNPEAFKGANQAQTVTSLLDAVKVKIGMIDCPSLYAYEGKIQHVVPAQTTSRVVDVSSEQIKKACKNRFNLNRRIFLRRLAQVKSKAANSTLVA